MIGLDREQQFFEASPPNGTSNSPATNDQPTNTQSFSSETSPLIVVESLKTTLSGANSLPISLDSNASKRTWLASYFLPHLYPTYDRPLVDIYKSLYHDSVVCCVQFSFDGTMLATSCHKTAQVLDLQTGEYIFTVPRIERTMSDGSSGNISCDDEDQYIRAVCFSPDCSKLVASMPNYTVRSWDITTNIEGVPMVGHEAAVYSLACKDDLIVSGSGDRTVRLWDAQTSTCKRVYGNAINGPADGVTSVALSPDSHLLAVASLDSIVRIYDTETGTLLDRYEGHDDSVYSVVFSPDGKNIISGSLDRNIMLWEVGSAGGSWTATRPPLVFQGHTDFVLSVSYSPDGRWLISGSKDRSVGVWDPRNSQLVLSISGHRNSVISVTSCPSKPYIATGSGDKTAAVWEYLCQQY